MTSTTHVYSAASITGLIRLRETNWDARLQPRSTKTTCGSCGDPNRLLSCEDGEGCADLPSVFVQRDCQLPIVQLPTSSRPSRLPQPGDRSDAMPRVRRLVHSARFRSTLSARFERKFSARH